MIKTKSLFKGCFSKSYSADTSGNSWRLFFAGCFVETYLTIDELASYLKLNIQTIRRWVMRREIPIRKIKRSVRFRLSEVETWIDGGGLTLAEKPVVESGASLFADTDENGGESTHD